MIKHAFALVALLAASPWAQSQAPSYPNHPIRVIVPFGAGSGVDVNGRFFAEQLGQVLGQAVIVENRPGADGVIGVMAVKNAPADGYTLLLASNSSLTVNPIIIKDLPYDPAKDLKPVSGLTRGMTVFVVATDSPLRTLSELVTAMKKADGRMNVGTYSTGYRLAVEWFAALAGTKFTNVPYKGSGAMFTDVIGNRLDWAVTDLVGAGELLKAGKFRALAVSGDGRYEEFPDVPTLKESGYPEYVNYTWSSLSVRSETSDDVTRKLSAALQTIFAREDTKTFLKRAKVELMPLPTDAMRKFQANELERWRRTAEAAGIKAE